LIKILASTSFDLSESGVAINNAIGLSPKPISIKSKLLKPVTFEFGSNVNICNLSMATLKILPLVFPVAKFDVAYIILAGLFSSLAWKNKSKALSPSSSLSLPFVERKFATEYIVTRSSLPCLTISSVNARMIAVTNDFALFEKKGSLAFGALYKLYATLFAYFCASL